MTKPVIHLFSVCHRLLETTRECVVRVLQVSFLPLDISQEDSIQDVLAQIDAAIQYGEDADVKVQEFDVPDDDM